MDQRAYPRSKGRPSSFSSTSTLPKVAPSKSIGTARLNTVLIKYAAIEFLAVACSAYFASAIYHFAILQSGHNVQEYIVAAVIIAILILVISLALQNFNAIQRQPRHMFLWRGLAAVALAFPIFLTILYFTHFTDTYSRGTFLIQIFSTSITVGCGRMFLYSWLQTAIASNRIEARRVVLIGDVSPCLKFADRLKINGIQTVGFFRLPTWHNMKAAAITNPKFREMIDQIRSLHADDIIILADNEIIPTMLNLASSIAELPAAVHIVPLDMLNVLASAQITELGDLQTIQLYRPPLSTFDLFIKRTSDLIFATIGVIVLSPLFLIVSIAIKLDSRGPVLFRQTRHGFDNTEIDVFKFRSMTVMENGNQFTQATKNDPRVTRVGRIMRGTNIDELPQLINVLRGDMSIVGPRPHATAHNALFAKMLAPFSRRHTVKPGITGWAQVNGFRGATDTLEKMQRRIEYDLYYVDNWSLLLDLKIILMTLYSKKSYINAY